MSKFRCSLPVLGEILEGLVATVPLASTQHEQRVSFPELRPEYQNVMIQDQYRNNLKIPFELKGIRDQLHRAHIYTGPNELHVSYFGYGMCISDQF